MTYIIKLYCGVCDVEWTGGYVSKQAKQSGRQFDPEKYPDFV